MTTKIDPSQIKHVECRFAVHAKSKEDDSDLHLVKEAVTLLDGTVVIPPPRLIKNYERNFYITSKGNQNHTNHKEWEKLDLLVEYRTTQAKLTGAVANALGKGWSRESLRDLCATPFVYGADILSTSIIKQEYKVKSNHVQTPMAVASFDTETDVLYGTNEVIIANISFQDKVYVACTKAFVANQTNVVERVYELCKIHIGDVIEKRKLKIEFEVLPNEIEVIKATMAKAHAWSPDILAVWNLEFDMDKIINACDRAGIEVEDLLSDPKVPKEYRHFKFKKGAAKKVTASGRIINFKPSQRWHTVFCPSSFYWLCAMGTYRQVRGGEPEETSYSLDNILKKHKLGGKLKFKEADHLSGLAWHKFMQEKYPLEYIVYNIVDGTALLDLDESTTDISLTLPMFAGCTDWSNFNSLPRKTMDALHWYIQQFGLVPGTTASDMTEEADSEVVDLKNWISMLPSHLVHDNGLRIINENPDLVSNLRTHVAD